MKRELCEYEMCVCAYESVQCWSQYFSKMNSDFLFLLICPKHTGSPARTQRWREERFCCCKWRSWAMKVLRDKCSLVWDNLCITTMTSICEESMTFFVNGTACRFCWIVFLNATITTLFGQTLLFSQIIFWALTRKKRSFSQAWLVYQIL